jgi:hypothetical protein
MAFLSAVSDPFIYLIIGCICAVLGIIAALYLKKSGKIGSTQKDKNPGQKRPRLAYQPEARPIPAVQPKAIPRPIVKSASLPKPKECNLLNGRSDITQSLLALVDKYSLDQFTIATADGLVFASSGADTAQDDAAQYGEMFANDPLSETPGIVLSGMNHKGSDLVLIVRTNLPVPDEIRSNIEKDTKDILNWWI